MRFTLRIMQIGFAIQPRHRFGCKLAVRVSSACLMLVRRTRLLRCIEIEILVDADPKIWQENPAAVATVGPLTL